MAQEKKIAFITGGNRGLGLQTAKELGQRGIHVVIGSRDKQKGDKAAKDLTALGYTAESVQCDVENQADHKAVFEFLQKKFGKLDILINNAGVMFGRNVPTSTESIDQIRNTFEANFFAPIALTQTLLPLIKKSPAGRIVNLSSILGSQTLHADPKSPIYHAKLLSYDASKAALNSFTIHLAYELRDTNIKVNSAHPGWVKTDMGGESAPMEISEGGKTSAMLATLPPDGPTGAFFHMGERLPW